MTDEQRTQTGWIGVQEWEVIFARTLRAGPVNRHFLERRDMTFVRDYYAHDANMLLFFERRQLLGWPRVETPTRTCSLKPLGAASSRPHRTFK
jgi:hypothetical protein